MAYLPLMVSVFASLLWFPMLSVSGATAATSHRVLPPPFGLLFGWLLHGEPVAGADLLGISPGGPLASAVTPGRRRRCCWAAAVAPRGCARTVRRKVAARGAASGRGIASPARRRRLARVLPGARAAARA